MQPPSYLFHPTSSKTTSSITFSWLLHLRWGAIASQFLLICIMGIFFTIDVPLLIVVPILFFEILSNLFFFYQKRQHKIITEWFFGTIMFVDVVLLTILLARTGGAMNPFTFLYLLHVVIGAVLMAPVTAWSLGFFTIACYASFFLPERLGPFSLTMFSPPTSNKPICVDVATLAQTTSMEMTLHLQGMLVAFAITTLFIIFFIGKIRKSLDSYHETIHQLKLEKTKSEKLAALATLSAGAAHEFSTPLATIDVASGEMLYYCKTNPVADELLDDIHLIKGQVKMCKNILDQLSADAGTHRGEKLSKFYISDLVEKLKMIFSNDQIKNININPALKNLQITAPLRTFIRMIKGVINNSIDATALQKTPTIILSIDIDNTFLKIIVKDNGTGMDVETIRHATEPFFTTKEPGKGMGLGLFLARSITEQLAGKLTIASKEKEGTTITIKLALTRLTDRFHTE